MGRVVSIAAGAPFVDRLARHMLDRHGPAGRNDLASAMVMVPTRRAGRSLQHAFLRASDGQALVLPLIRPLGDVDDDEPAMLSPLPGDEVDIAPAISATERRLLLSRLVLARMEAEDETPDAPAALGLAQSLADLIDEVATERLDFSRLAGLAPEQFQEHWQQTIDFLSIATTAWPAMLAERGLMDPAERRDRLTGRLAAYWRQNPPDHPVYIAGSTGSVPGTADLMGAVLQMDEGWIVLPGLDRTLDEIDRRAALQEPAHPQHGMLHLLGRLGVSEVDELGTPEPVPPRLVLLHEALRPASTTDRWSELATLPEETLDGLTLIEAASPRDEALAIALRLREALNIPERTAALVTPDRDLARRVAAEMARFNVALDDSAGQPLRLTRAGTFLQCAAVALGDGFAPADLLALLKHPLAMGGLAAGELRRAVRRLERRYLRGIRSYADLADLAARVDGAPDWLHQMADHAARFNAAAGDFAPMLTAHLAFCEWLASSDTETGAERLWRGEDGEAAARAVGDLIDSADAAPVIDAAAWPAAFDRLVGGVSVRPRYGLHPRLSILGPLEARLQTFDLTVLGGLNEGVWPAATGNDPWMSRPMRAEFGLPAPERRTGLQAHDFIQLAASGDVILTRSAKSEGTPTVSSRWLLRLQSVARGAELHFTTEEETVGWVSRLDRAPDPRPVAQPTPRPAVERRPPELPVTAVESLIRDPYAIFAQRVLGLRRLDPIDEEPGPRHRGTLLHKAFEELAKVHKDDWTEAFWPTLEGFAETEFDRKGIPPAWRALWMRRLETAARWLLRHEQKREDRVANRIVEQKGEIVGLSDLPEFKLTATADRIDVLAKGASLIVDYKTGSPPSQKQIEAGFAVQLPLTALILSRGGFGDLPADIAGMVHIRLHGTGDGGEWKPVKADDIDGLIHETAEGVSGLLKSYADPATPYLSRPHVQFARDLTGDYDHLARVAEWSVAAGEAGEGE